jgi:hypothetical protein
MVLVEAVIDRSNYWSLDYVGCRVIASAMERIQSTNIQRPRRGILDWSVSDSFRDLDTPFSCDCTLFDQSDSTPAIQH